MIIIEQLNEIRHVTLAGILCQTVEGMIEVQRDAFEVVNQFEYDILYRLISIDFSILVIHVFRVHLYRELIFHIGDNSLDEKFFY